MKQTALWVAGIFFALFVWPTPYRYIGQRRINRFEWALPVLGDRGILIGVLAALVVGACIGYLIGRSRSNAVRP